MHELTEKLWAIEPWRKIKINKIITDWLGDKAIELACTYPKKTFDGGRAKTYCEILGLSAVNAVPEKENMNYKTCQHGTDINRKSCLKCALEYESARNSITVKDSLTVQPDPQRKVEKWCEHINMCRKSDGEICWYIEGDWGLFVTKKTQFCPYCAAPRTEKKKGQAIQRLILENGMNFHEVDKINELIDAVNALRSEGLVKDA